MTAVRNLAGWALLPALVVMQFFDLRRGLVGPDWTWSAFLVGYALVVVAGLPLVWSRLREVGRPGWVAIGAFTAVLAYAAVSAVVSGQSLVTSRTSPAVVPPDTFTGPLLVHRLVPLATAWLTMAAAVVAVLLVPAGQRLARLWWAAVALVLTSLVAWPRAVLVHDSPRLATGMGGSATIHLVFLLCAGVFMGAAMAGHRVRWSLVGATSSVLCVVLTGSRAGVLTLAVFVVVVLAWLGGRINRRLAGLVLAGVVLVGAAVVAFVPAARHVLVFGDELRQRNLATAWSVFTESPTNVLVGVGSGRLWPWYSFDARWYVVPWRGEVGSSAGVVLTNPHSVLLGVGVELGMVGLAMVGVLVAVLVWRAVQVWRRPVDGASASLLPGDSWRDGIVLALAAGLVAFAFDFYLFKNFAVSFWWWVCFAAVFSRAPSPSER
ncbi:hypothetical protein ACQB6R_00310 [Propionibacteriaceae bacterium G1746]|uniref:hypothetical protein n=1 Tax=Aestuariimicrobium sp. G57 TaxID=3418485 RepID=UPI003C16EAAE